MINAGMINSNLMPPVSLPADCASIFALLHVISDPEATNARLTELATVSAEIRQMLDTARKETAALDVQREELKVTLVADRAAWDATVEQRHVALESECAVRLRDVEAREQSVAKVEAQASADAKAAATLRQDLERRVQQVQSIAAA